MNKWLSRSWFPLLFEGIGSAYSAQLLSFVIRFTLIIAGLSFGLNALFASGWERVIPGLIVFLAGILLNELLKREKVYLTALLYWGLITLVACGLASLSGGITSPVFSLLLVPTFFAGAIFGLRGGALLLGISLVSGIVFIVLAHYQMLSQRITYWPIDYLVIYTVMFISLMALLFTVMKILQDALKQFQHEVAVRQQAIASFAKLERQYKAIFDHTNDGVFLMDFDSTILDTNQRGAEMYGYERHEMIGRKGLEFVVPEERDLGQERLTELILKGTIPIYERTMLHRDGHKIHIEVNLSLVYDETGAPAQAQSVQRDITKRKETEARLRDIENRYRTLFEGVNDGVFILGMDRMVKEVNQQAANMLGYDPAEMIGRDAGFFVVPTQKENVIHQIDTLLEKGYLPIYERLVRKRDGTIITFEINAGVIYDDHGQPQGIQSIVRDISARKQAEEELHTLVRQLERQRTQIQTSLEVSKAAISILDPQTLIQQTVEWIKTQFEYYYVGLFLVEETKQFAVLRAGTGEAGKKMLAAGHQLPIGDGSMIGWCIANQQPRIALDVGLDAIRFENPLLPDTRSEMALPLITHGTVIGGLTVQSDIEAAFSDEDIAVLQVMTDLVAVAIENARLHAQITQYAEELEQRVRERTAQLQTINRELEAFSYSVSHDLRTPLRAINGYSSILLEDFAPEFSPQARAYQEKIRGNAIRMGELVDGLLSFSRLGRKKLQKSEVNPQRMVQEILEDLENEIVPRQVEIQVGDLPLCEADPLLLKQVFINLIANALKFTRDKVPARIEIGSRLTRRGLAYFVKDNGVGFDMQYADQLFGVFRRLHREEEFEGTGVGLAIIQRIILRHGGDVWAEAEPEKGATFFFTLGGVASDESGIFF